ncbi:MAG TPA: DUF3025 domain-containing protein [Polyangiaceae bacterium]|jgi:hypothetical protein
MLGPLRKKRQDGAAWDARFFERSALCEPIVPAARMFVECTDWPEPDAVDRALAARAGVRFVVAERRPRRQRGPVALDDLYDARIARGEVPTRPKNWHDFLNALVWATFPRSKAALHARQHRAVRAWAFGDSDVARALPNARTRELDALALVDEGGILLAPAGRAVFGHALYEGLVLGVPAMVARGVPLSELSDEALAARLAEPISPEVLPREKC